jgi:LDH2 family malate/lactate/ureidoglycolate dehydrogenase
MPETLRFDASDLKRFSEKVFIACHAPGEEAALISEHLIKANLMGYDSHGIIRICQYVKDVKRGVIVPVHLLRSGTRRTRPPSWTVAGISVK